RVPAADDEGPLARVGPAFLPGDVGNAVGDAVRSLGLAGYGKAIDTHRVRLRPRAGRVDHGFREQAVLAARVAVPEDEGSILAALVRHQIMAKPCDPGDLRS